MGLLGATWGASSSVGLRTPDRAGAGEQEPVSRSRAEFIARGPKKNFQTTPRFIVNSTARISFLHGFSTSSGLWTSPGLTDLIEPRVRGTGTCYWSGFPCLAAALHGSGPRLPAPSETPMLDRLRAPNNGPQGHNNGPCAGGRAGRFLHGRDPIGLKRGVCFPVLPVSRAPRPLCFPCSPSPVLPVST